MNTVNLKTETSGAEISLIGGEIKRWQCAGNDLLWTPDNAFWIRTCPVLFPVVGWLNNNSILIDGRLRPMGVHGFAKTSTFELVDKTDTTVVIELHQSDDVADIYPFNFRLRLEYRLSPNTLSTDIEVLNVGDVPMPYGVGLHPGFCWPLPGSSGSPHSVRFGSMESNLVPVVSVDGYIGRETRKVPFDGRTLPLHHALFENDVLCFLNANSSNVSFGNDEGQAITISSTNFPHWGIWSKPGANFLCIQNWTSYGDMPDFAGSILEKPSMIVLGSGMRQAHSVIWEFTQQWT